MAQMDGWLSSWVARPSLGGLATCLVVSWVPQGSSGRDRGQVYANAGGQAPRGEGKRRRRSTRHPVSSSVVADSASPSDRKSDQIENKMADKRMSASRRYRQRNDEVLRSLTNLFLCGQYETRVDLIKQSKQVYMQRERCSQRKQKRMHR